jgi:outer membrane protein OmpA-like peptidoglycan-associated protein
VVVNGYASATSGEDDIRISLDRALQVKKILQKIYPQAKLQAIGHATIQNSKCVKYSNRCVVITFAK